MKGGPAVVVGEVGVDGRVLQQLGPDLNMVVGDGLPVKLCFVSIRNLVTIVSMAFCCFRVSRTCMRGLFNLE